eukprot:TRINITY_DN25005_c0_g1_i1.p1 TRINITY_DN25005_c0_g1~~TRINITY_DN25005_c0_g1_i1.p1  ORF type:complete len:222 (-),score=40.49 TRINITY_DN25005_c0_g1_i1:144-809(-)
MPGVNYLTTIITTFLLVCYLPAFISGFPIDPPSRPFGHSFGQGQDVILDVFIDIACSDSKMMWPAIRGALGSFEKELEKNLNIRVNFFPLPYHTHSMDVSLAAEIVAEQYPDQLADFLDLAFEKQDLFQGEWNSTVFHSSRFDILKVISGIVSEIVPMKEEEFFHQMQSFDVNMRGRLAFKFAAAYRGINGAPIFQINGVDLMEAPTTTKGWEHLLRNYLK